MIDDSTYPACTGGLRLYATVAVTSQRERFVTTVSSIQARKRQGIGSALFAAGLFGASTPFTKILLEQVSPVMMAGLLYAGSGIGLSGWLAFRRQRIGHRAETPLGQTDLPWLLSAIIAGGVIGPVLFTLGLIRSSASAAALLLNLEGVFTALLAWFVFAENFDRRIALGMLSIVAGGVVLSWDRSAGIGITWGSMAIVAACLMWAIDNNVTRKISACDPVQIAAIKGVVAGAVNIALALGTGSVVPGVALVSSACLLGFLSYGLSLVLFVRALRHLGTARTSAYFSTAPFVGTVLAIVLLHETPSVSVLVAIVLMGLGVFLHVTEVHDHEHGHSALEHEHWHDHDEHHQHEHPPGMDAHGPHSHPHVHPPIRHTHAHYPDVHHRHVH